MCVCDEEGGREGGGGRGADTELKTKTQHVNVGNTQHTKQNTQHTTHNKPNTFYTTELTLLYSQHSTYIPLFLLSHLRFPFLLVLLPSFLSSSSSSLSDQLQPLVLPLGSLVSSERMYHCCSKNCSLTKNKDCSLLKNKDCLLPK